MAGRSDIPRLTDIVDASAFVRNEMADLTLDAFENDRRKRWAVERGIEIISEASRRLTDELKARHPEIPWPKVAGIGNVLRHDYEDVSAPVMWKVSREDLPLLEQVCRDELAAALANEPPDS
jgi:uncharacterized protein with HEPN domain